jgi:magnesium transporter
MIERFSTKNLTWIDIENPTRQDVLSLIQEFDIHEVCAEELLIPTVRPKVDRFGDHMYMVLHFPELGNQKDLSEYTEHEIDIILGKDFMITVRYQPSIILHEFRKTFEEAIILEKNSWEHAGMLYFYLMRTLYRTLGREFQKTATSIRYIEQEIFSDHEALMVRKISALNRSLMHAFQSMHFHEEVLDSAERVTPDFFGQDFIHYMHHLKSEYLQNMKLLESHRSIVNDLRITNDSLLSTKNNEIIRNLTVMSFVTFPLSLIAGIFGMNTIVPFQQHPQGFWIIFVIMGAAMSAMFAYFYHKRWF